MTRFKPIWEGLFSERFPHLRFGGLLFGGAYFQNVIHIVCHLFCRVWNVHTGEMLNTLIHHCEAVLHLRFQEGMMVTCSKVFTKKVLSVHNINRKL